jgi:hypothetical protein
MLCMLPDFSVGQVPLAFGSMVGVGPLVSTGVEPLEPPLASLTSDPEEPLEPPPPLEAPEPEGPPAEEPPLEPSEPELPFAPADPPLPGELSSPAKPLSSPEPALAPAPEEAPGKVGSPPVDDDPHATKNPRTMIGQAPTETIAKRRRYWKPKRLPSPFIRGQTEALSNTVQVGAVSISQAFSRGTVHFQERAKPGLHNPAILRSPFMPPHGPSKFGGMMNSRSIFALTLILFSATCGCGSSSTPENTNTNTNTTNTVTFAKVYADVLSGSCTPCHAPGGTGDAAGRLDMSTQAAAYTNLEKSAAGASCKASGLQLVVPGAASMSLLVEKVESAHPPCGTQMPFGCGGSTPCLSAAQVQEIVDWINDGADNN